VVARRQKLKEITECGLRHMEDKKVSVTLLGHEIILQDVVKNVAGAVGWAEDYIKDAAKDLPYASIVIAGVSLVLPLLKNPSAAEAANQDGFTYVTSQMRYYVAMESLLLPEDMNPDLKSELTDRLVDIYKHIISFQVRSIIRFYRSRTKNFFRGTINYDGWDKTLQDIKNSDAALVLRFETAMSATSLAVLKNLAQEAEASRTALYSLLEKQQELIKVNRDHMEITQKIDQRLSDAENRACLRDLFETDPRLDKKRIEKVKGGLLEDSYQWVIQNTDFIRWRNNGENRLLWIKGDPGKGKTMLLCGIIDELTKSTGTVSFFFCQAADARINSATAVLRGLIYQLVKQQPSLLPHIRESYDTAGKQLFDGVNAWVALSEIFINILADPVLGSIYVVIDALDECIADLPLLLDLIVQRSIYSHAKWVVSSRNWPNIEEHLDAATKGVRLCLELNPESISAAVSTYIRYKVNQLVQMKKYDDKTRDAVEHHLVLNANDTFLWVALVCQELAEIPRWNSPLPKLEAFPPELDSLYQRMLDQICNSENADLCKRILAVVSVIYRPISLFELTSIVDMPESISINHEVLADIIRLCGSFLTVRDCTIFFVHQSAKDFLLEKSYSVIFPDGEEIVHYTIFFLSLQAMSRTLQHRLCSSTFPTEQVVQPSPDPLASTKYSCVYWIDHLRNCDPGRNAKQDFSVGGPVDTFFKKSYLHWLEALSLLRSVSEGMLSMARLEDLLKVSFSETITWPVLTRL
jgi:hypothetical protein